MCKAVKNFNFKNPRWQTAAILTSKNRDKIYVTMMQRKRIGCPPSWVFKIIFLTTDALVNQFCVIMPNIVEIG